MATTINGDGEIGLGGTSSSQGTLKLYEDTDNGTNYVGLQAPASIASNVTFTLPNADGTSGQFLQTNGSGGLSFATVSAGLTLGTPISTGSGATAEITGIPSGVKQINLTFSQIQYYGTGIIPAIQVSTSSAYLTSGYVGRRGTLRSTGVANLAMGSYIDMGDGNYFANTDYMSGSLIMTLLDSSTNTWTGTSSLAVTGSNNAIFFSAFTFSLASEINKLKLYDALGSNFAAGKFNIAYF